MMAPLLRRSLAPRGRTPILKHKGSHRDRVSLNAALSLSPREHRIALHFRTYRKEFVNNQRAAEFLRQLLRKVRGKVIVVWDRGTMHRGPPIEELLARCPRLSLEKLPSYAPDLNPVENLWNYLKYGKLANYAPKDVKELDGVALKHLRRTRQSPKRLRSFFRASNLPLPFD